VDIGGICGRVEPPMSAVFGTPSSTKRCHPGIRASECPGPPALKGGDGQVVANPARSGACGPGLRPLRVGETGMTLVRCAIQAIISGAPTRSLGIFATYPASGSSRSHGTLLVWNSSNTSFSALILLGSPLVGLIKTLNSGAISKVLSPLTPASICPTK
jgi:hypothetical protein